MKALYSKIVAFGWLTPFLPLLVTGLMIWMVQGADVLRWPGAERAYLGSVIRSFEDNYLFRMRDTHLGCMTLQYRPADIVFIGDSHSYAGYDYELLQARLSPAIVGNCAFSGMFPENVIHFLTEARRSGLLPKLLIFGISPEMFWEDLDSLDRIARAYREIKRLNDSRENLGAILTERFKVLVDFRKVDDLKIARRDFNIGIQNLSEGTIERFFQRYSNGIYPIDYWSNVIANGKPNPKGTAVIEKICAAAKSNQVRLGVVYIPESRWMLSRFSAEQRQAFRDVMQKFSCADWVDFSFSQNGGPNIWYVNRYAIKNYPYEAWNDPDAAVAWNRSVEERRWQFFDPDHMNPMGAAAFSERVANEILKNLR